MKNLKRILSYIKPYKLAFYLTLLGTLILAIIAPIRPLIIGFMIDRYIMKSIPNNETDNMITGFLDLLNESVNYTNNGFVYWTIITLSTLIIEAILRFFTVYYSNYLGQNIIRDLREKMFSHLQNFKTQYFDKNPIGKMVTRLVSDMEALSEIFSNGIIVILGDVFTLAIVVTLMFLTNWKFSLLVLIPIPILLYATKIFKNAIKKAYQKESSQVSKLNNFVQERIIGMSLVQLFTREKIEYKKFTEINAEHRNAHIKTVWAYSIFFPIVEILSSASIAFVIFYASYQIIDTPDRVSGGQLFSFILWINMLYRPIRMLADKFNVLQRGLVRSRNIFQVLDDNQEIIQENNIDQIDNFKGDVSFQNVSFAYNEPEFVLKNISFNIKAGQTVAFVGATGAGKSSIINILSRFYEFQKGEIKVDNLNIRDLSLNLIRKEIAVVLQDVFLFSDTIFNNITLYNTAISREEVIEAAKVVGVHDFIMKLPGNYDFDVKERGGVLSTGQRQLISFIRAYVYNPKILILDEATSSIDTETEELIQKAIDKITKGRTSIVIAHRLSTIKNADKIIVLDKGEIMEQGSHEELMMLGGHYFNLNQVQQLENT